MDTMFIVLQLMCLVFAVLAGNRHLSRIADALEQRNNQRTFFKNMTEPSEN